MSGDIILDNPSGSKPSPTIDTTRITLSDLKKIHTKSIATAEQFLGIEKGSSRKKFNPERRKLSKLISNQEIEAEKEHRKELQETRDSGEKDALTGLLNLSGFKRRLAAEVNRSKRSNTGLEIIFMDANNLKPTNDLEGHDVGNVYLQMLAQVLRDSARKFDILARYGGDEFVAVLVKSGEGEGKKYWERILPQLGRHGLQISAGACEVDLTHPEGSLALADQLMYDAKGLAHQSGQSEIIFAEP